MRILATLTGEGYTSTIVEEDDGRVHFKGDLDIDADGAYRAYHPDNHSGLDDLRNARDGQGGWCGVVTAHGKPVVQGAQDPAPGFYVSTTSLSLPHADGTPRAAADPRRYVDAESVPFIVVPPIIPQSVRGIVLGCKARITDTRTGKSVDCVVADVGPRTRDGEASIAAAKVLGIPSSARSGGEDAPVFLYELWPGTAAVVNGVTYPLQPLRG
jgi:hypothetical protein